MRTRESMATNFQKALSFSPPELESNKTPLMLIIVGDYFLHNGKD